MFGNKDKKLIKAVDKGNYEKVKELLKMGANANTRDLLRDNCTPLMIAASSGLDKIAEILIEFGADIDAVSDHNYTALISAVIKNKYVIVKLLLKSGANFNIKTFSGMNALKFAEEKLSRDPLFDRKILTLLGTYN